MARQIKIGLNSGRKVAGSGFVGKVLSRILAYNGLGARLLTSIAMHSANMARGSTTLGVKAEPRNVFYEDALLKRMQMLR
jgi:hypothetical protein